jgi:hypothetical protein
VALLNEKKQEAVMPLAPNMFIVLIDKNTGL